MRSELTGRTLVSRLRRMRRLEWLRGPKTRRISSLVLVLTGTCLLMFTVGAYSWMMAEQRRLTKQWETKNTRAGALPNASEPDQPSLRSADRDQTLLSIPKIHLQAAVLEGTDRKTLLLAPGHLKKTALPGDPGNSVIAGHRDTFFRHVYELNPGDEIVVQRAGRQYHYVVTAKSIVGPHDTWVAGPTGDSRLTLVTCYPTYYIGPAPQRAIVVASLRAWSESTTATATKPRS